MAGVVQFRTKPRMGKKYKFFEKLQYYPYRDGKARSVVCCVISVVCSVHYP